MTQLETVYQLIDDRRRLNMTMRSIAAEADVGYEWMRKLAQREFDDPGSMKIERVYNVLVAADRRSRRKAA